MKEKIIHYLSQLEKEKNIKILLACETGSRAWGFPSPDSDYDVRIIYVHSIDWYLNINEQGDTIERMFENRDIDITGWELRKSLRLLRKSNAALLERIQSPILYQADEKFVAGINELTQANYSRIATVHHYLSLAKKMHYEIKQGESYKLKKFFYVLRSASVCKWILEYEKIPPIEFIKVLDGLTLKAKLYNRILELMALKATVDEAYLHTGESEIFSFIEACIEETTEKASSLPASKSKIEDLNALFKSFVC